MFPTSIVTGEGGGLRREILEWLITQGIKIIVVGQTEPKLQTTVKEMGHSKIYYILDTEDISAIPSFIKQVVDYHLEVDCLINNAGVQRPLDVNNFDLHKADQEIDINIGGPIHLAIALLDRFKSKPNGAITVNVSSVLGYIPTSVISPFYNGTKARIHFWSMNLRTQLKDPKERIVEIKSPTGATGLRRERANADHNRREKNSSALSVDEFKDSITKDRKASKEVIGAGPRQKVKDRWSHEFGPHYEKVAGTK